MKELQKPESSCREDDSQAGDDGDEKEEKDMGDDFDQEEMIKTQASLGKTSESS